MGAQFCNREPFIKETTAFGRSKGANGLAPAWDLIILLLTSCSSQLPGAAPHHQLLGNWALFSHCGSQVTLSETLWDMVAWKVSMRATS